MGVGRPGSKRGLTRRQSAEMSRRWDHADAERNLANANIRIAELEATIKGKNEQIKLLKSLVGKKVKA